MKAVLFSTLACLALAASTHAQTVTNNRQAVHTLSTPVQRYVLEYATGELTRIDGPSASQVGIHAASAVSYQNDCTTGSFVGVGTQELVDWGVKSAGLTTIVDSFEFAYATDSADLSVGGFGASIDIALYEGTTGSGVLGTEVARFSFTGLPGTISGGFAGFEVTVDLSGGFEICIDDGNIGYGYCSNDIGTTGPLITNLNTCSTGQVDVYDAWVCPASTSGTFNGSFFFGGSPTASFYMVINEDDGSEVSTTALNNGSGVNPILLDDGGVPPVLGQVWAITVDTAVGGHSVSSCVFYKGSLPPGTVILNVGEVIVDPTSGLDFTNTVNGTGLNDHSVLVPKDVTLLGFDYTVQAVAYVGAPIQLGNALDIHIGF